MLETQTCRAVYDRTGNPKGRREGLLAISHEESKNHYSPRGKVGREKSASPIFNLFSRILTPQAQHYSFSPSRCGFLNIFETFRSISLSLTFLLVGILQFHPCKHAGTWRRLSNLILQRIKVSRSATPPCFGEKMLVVFRKHFYAPPSSSPPQGTGHEQTKTSKQKGKDHASTVLSPPNSLSKQTI